MQRSVISFFQNTFPATTINDATLIAVLANPELCCSSGVVVAVLQLFTVQASRDSVASAQLITSVVAERVNDPRWEVRDATVELLLAILANTGAAALRLWSIDRQTVFWNVAAHCTEDESSFVRASTGRLLTEAATHGGCGWGLGLEEWIERGAAMLHDDEDTVRRAAGDFLLQLQARSPALFGTGRWTCGRMPRVLANIFVGDPDWEVRIKGQAFIRQSLGLSNNKIACGPEHSMCASCLADVGGITVIFAHLDDPDRLVRLGFGNTIRKFN
jgi:hypothetical protein